MFPFLQTLSAVPPPTRAYLRTLIHNADLEHLEKVVLDGHGQVVLLLLLNLSHLHISFHHLFILFFLPLLSCSCTCFLNWFPLQKLLGESSALDRVGRFLGALPDFMDTISILHNATTAGIVPVVQELMSSERLALSRFGFMQMQLHKLCAVTYMNLTSFYFYRDQYGATPLHKVGRDLLRP